jgi:hypothetical protein
MAKTKKSSGKGSKTHRSSKPRKTSRTSRAPRKISDAARTRRLARELEKAENMQTTGAERAEQLRQQMIDMRERCPHVKLKIDEATGNVVCRNCLAVVGVAPAGNTD